MNIKVLIDFEVLGDSKTNKKQFDENIAMFKKIITIYKTDLFISLKNLFFFNSLKINSDNMNIFIEKGLKDKENFITEISKKYDWILYFKNDTTIISCEQNIIYSPINLRGDISQFKNISFTEHAKHKKYYHDFSNYYMYTLANDTEKEGQF